MEYVKKPMEVDILCTIDEETFLLLAKNTWIGDSCTSHHNTNNDTGLYDITKINKSVQGSLGNMFAIKKGSLT